ncbi:hypothetical protein K0M31_002819 [Melipona bicolor]|uniref:Uncharacterized protein n=1 Tax=Melipona bicolor TaxID=60889 RepID=A0AA40KPV2_9HYME|nr:hypothetical protein K0M31_002819 [Melipona bicolor]
MEIRRRADTSLLFQVVVALLLADTSSDRDRPEWRGGRRTEGRGEERGKKETEEEKRKRNEEEGKEKKRRWRTTEDEDEKKGRTKEA